MTYAIPILITPERARQIAYEWHGGQSSPLYAFASAGLVKDPIALGREIRDCMLHAEPGVDVTDLEKLNEYVAERVQPTRPGARWPHYAAPWASKDWT